MVRLNSMFNNSADCLKAEELEGMYPLGKKGIGSPATRAYLSMYPYLEGVECCIDGIPFPPPMSMKLVVAKDTGEGSHHC